MRGLCFPAVGGRCREIRRRLELWAHDVVVVDFEHCRARCVFKLGLRANTGGLIQKLLHERKAEVGQATAALVEVLQRLKSVHLTQRKHKRKLAAHASKGAVHDSSGASVQTVCSQPRSRGGEAGQVSELRVALHQS